MVSARRAASRGGRADLADLDAEGGEIVVVVLPRLVDVRGPGVQVVLRRRLEPEQHGRVHRTLAGGDGA